MKPTSPPSQAAAAAAGHRHHAPEEMQNDDTAHEPSDVNIPALAWSIGVMFGVVGGTAILMVQLFNFLEGQAKARDPKLSPLAMPATTMPSNIAVSPFFSGAPEPKLMTDEASRLKQVRTEEQAVLNGYGWVDEKAGVARISIDRAKELTRTRGLAVRPDPLTDERLGTRRPSSGESSAGRNVTRTLAPSAPAAPPTPAPAATEHKPAAPHK